jgi:hypothetical protein
MAMMAIMASATSTMVTPRSRSREWQVRLNFRIAGGFMPFAQFSFIATDAAVIVVGKTVDLPKRLATLPNRHAKAY